VLSGDPALVAIVRLSLAVSLSAVFVAALFLAWPFGALIALNAVSPAGRASLWSSTRLLGLPPVVVGFGGFS